MASNPDDDEYNVENLRDVEPDPIPDSPPFKYYLVRQDVELDINFLEQSVKGRVEIVVHATENTNLDEIAIDARQCQIDTGGITVQKFRNSRALGEPAKAPATYKDPYDLLDYSEMRRWNATHASNRRIRVRPLTHTREVDLPADIREVAGCTPVDGSIRVKLKHEEQSAGGQRIIVRKPSAASDSFSGKPDGGMEYLVSIPFENKNIRDGLQFVGVEPGDTRYTHAYTRHSYEPGTACSLFPCLDDYGSIGYWKISIKCPRTLGDALQQPLVTQRQQNGSRVDPEELEDAMGQAVLSEEDKLLEMTVVCSGLLTDEILDPEDDSKKVMTFESEKPTSVHMVGFAVGPFEHVDLFSDFRTEEDDDRLGASALKIHGYCLPRRADWVRNTCVALATAADYLSLTFSGYPHGSYKLCFVEDLVEDTVPLSSFSFISTRLLYPEGVIDTEVEVTRKLVHSLATQWSGVLIVPNTRRDIWATIGIASYMTDLFMKKLCGNNEYRFRIKTATDKLAAMDVDRPSLYELGQYLHVSESQREFMELKAPLVLFILDKRIVKATSGSHNLTQILSRLFTKAKIEGDNIITTKGFRKLCEKASKYNHLDTFWAQWVYGSGCPKIDVTHKFNKKRLCVEMTIKQKQGAKEENLTDESDGVMKRSDFLQAIKGQHYHVPTGSLQTLFTGPITIRIHEADGTPYEHIVEIREDNAQNREVKFDIPYNTKYKRLKRRREKKQVAAGAAGDAGGVPEEGYIYSLGDTINTPADVERYLTEEYDESTERRMDAESYEWLRIDTDFEWLCSMKVEMAAYMFVSQLQQDRDIVAQHDTMVYLKKEIHPVSATVLVRTLMDIKYYHGIRTKAAELLKNQCSENMGMRGMVQLEMAFRDMFCFPDTTTPRPNDFSDKRQYLVQCAIPESLSMIRDGTGKCPMRVKRFILNILRLNNNNENPFSDDVYVATLIKSVANTLMVNKKDSLEVNLGEGSREDEKQFETEALEEINRYLRRDEWTHSYRNVWTIAGLEAKRRLMKAGVIPIRAIDFLKYLQDTTLDEVRIKCWEALVDLGFMVDPVLFKLFMVHLSTDRSPYVRHQLLKVFSEGLAAIAFGEYPKPSGSAQKATRTVPAVKTEPDGDADADGDLDLDLGDAEDPLVVVGNEASDRALEEQRRLKERKKSLPLALAGLKKELETTYADVQPQMKSAIWIAVDSPVLGRAEKITLLELCAAMFEADRFLLTLKLPKGWKVSRPVPGLPGTEGMRVPVHFKSYYRTKPRSPEPPPAVIKMAQAAVPEPKRPLIISRSSSIKVNRPSVSGPTLSIPVPGPPQTPAIQRASSIATPLPSYADSIVATPVSAHGPPAPASARPETPKPPLERKNTVTISTSSSSTIKQKRPRDQAVPPAAPVAKRPKVEKPVHAASGPAGSSKAVGHNGVAKRRRIVTLKHPNMGTILQRAGISTGVSGQTIRIGNTGPPRPTFSGGAVQLPSPLPSIQAKPARKPLPSGAPGQDRHEHGSASASSGTPAPPPGRSPMGQGPGTNGGGSAPRTPLPREGSTESAKPARSIIKLVRKAN